MDWKKKLTKENLVLILVFGLALGLRLFKFNQIPASLFGDEIDTGYQAYSILKTGRDYFGNQLPFHFQSFGDWRMPLYIYLTVPFVALFGLTELATRLPSLFFSLASFPIVYFLVKEISQKKKIALLTLFFLSLSPWHLHFSRVALEVTLFNLLFLAGLLLFLKGLKSKKKNHFIFASISFGFSLYAYSTAKLFIPLILVGLFLLFKRKLSSKKRIFLFLLPFLLISLPVAIDIISGQGGARFRNIAIFGDPSVTERVGLSRHECPWSRFWERAFHNKVLIYLDDFSKNYLVSFSTQFLFTRGDPSFRHNPTERGQVYPVYVPLILLGILGLLGEFLKTKEKKLVLPLLILFLTPIPAALTQGGGSHAIRTYQFLPWWQFLSAWGLVFGIEKIRANWQKGFLIFSFGLILLINFAFFFHDYFSHFPSKPGAWWRWWNYGYREVFEFVNQVEKNFDQIYLSPAYDPPIVYALFYNQYSPEKIQKEITISPVGFDKFIFANPDLAFLKSREKQEGILFVTTPGYVAAMGYDLKDYPEIEILKEIKYPDKEAAFYIFKTR